MPKYMRVFDTHEAYELWSTSEQYVTPSVAACINENEVHYNLVYVDLGLPSGTLWAAENIKDASRNELYFAWGEIQGYTAEQVGTDKYFAWEGDNADYKYGVYDKSSSPNYGMTKYNKTDNLTVLEPDDDAATVLWGSNWCIPSAEQFIELFDNTTSSWTTQNGINGMLFTSVANGNTLFFPALGVVDNGEMINVGGLGCYWSCSLNNSDVLQAFGFAFNTGSDKARVANGDRYNGLSVRPVRLSLSVTPDPGTLVE